MQWKWLATTAILLGLLTRFYGSQLHPPSPYWEEVALGYDAYSIAQTGRDHHGNFLPLTAFESFGDYKPSLYFYTVVPFIKLLGLNLLAVRLPTILASLVLIYGLAWLVRQIAVNFLGFRQDNQLRQLWYLSIFLAICSPWLLYFSRSAWESTLASALILWGVNLAILFWEQRKIPHLILGLMCLVLASYAYHAARLSVPLLIGLGASCYLWQWWRGQKWHQKSGRRELVLVTCSLLLALLLWWPILQSMRGGSGQQRISETSILTDISVIEQSNNLRQQHDYSWWSRLLYHRYVLFGTLVAKNLLSHFDWGYLFVHGDHNPRHSIQSFGNFYVADLVFLLLGVFVLLRRPKLALWLGAYLLITLLPAAFTKATPHALRTLAAWPAFMLILVLGANQLGLLVQKVRDRWRRISLILLMGGVYLGLVGQFFYHLLYIYPQQYRQEWQFGYQAMVEQLEAVAEHYDAVYITREKGRPAMYYFFYQQTDPQKVQVASLTAAKDQSELLEFQQLHFIDQPMQIDPTDEKILLVSSPRFYEQHFANQQAWKLLGAKQGEWVFYERQN